jgi:hypothetical protein
MLVFLTRFLYTKERLSEQSVSYMGPDSPQYITLIIPHAKVQACRPFCRNPPTIESSHSCHHVRSHFNYPFPDPATPHIITMTGALFVRFCCSKFSTAGASFSMNSNLSASAFHSHVIETFLRKSRRELYTISYEVNEMNNGNLTCKACGHNSFAKGKMEGHASVRPLKSYFSFGSRLILTICKKCGEVASIKVENFEKF